MGWQDREYARGRQSTVGAFRAHRGSRFPLVGGSIVTTLIVINVAVFVLEEFFPSVALLLSGGAVRGRFGVEFQHGIAEMWAKGVLGGQVWRLVTAQYLHAGTGHLFINMLVLHFLGRPIERMWSVRKFFWVYTLCGISGNVFYTILGAKGVIHPDMPAVGASGSIYGLLGIAAVLFPHATVYVYFLFPIKIRTAAMIFGGIAFFSIVQRGDNYGGEACHLAGLGFGVWWAMKGDGWWSSSTWFRPSMWRTRINKSQPGAFQRKVAQRRDDQELIDRILKKVYDGGVHSLSESEKAALQAATKRQQDREKEAGRTDRL